MGKFKGKSSLSEFDVRELLEIVIAGQIVLARKITSLEKKVAIKDEETTNESFIRAFYKLYKDNREVIREVNNYLQNQDDVNMKNEAEKD